MAGQGFPCWLQDLSSDLRLEEVLDRTIENALQACPNREVALLIWAEDELSLVRAPGLRPGVKRQLEGWARGCPKALTDPFEIADLGTHAELSKLAAQVGACALRAVPLESAGRSLGILLVLALEGDPFDEPARELLDAFGEQASVALANAHLFQRVLESATHDALTGLPNRRAFERALASELERASRYGAMFSLAMLDLDSFKRLNDTKGHAAGDELLRRTAATLEEACRAADVAARLGGDEFGLLLPATNQFEAAALCERLRARVEKLGDVSLSWGIAEYPAHGKSSSKLTRAADAAMYASKPLLSGGERVS